MAPGSFMARLAAVGSATKTSLSPICQPVHQSPPPTTAICGWLVGAGIEWAFASNWSAKVEYNFLGLDDRTEPHPLAVLTGDDAEAVMLDLMQPLAAGRQLIGFGWKARRNEPGRQGTLQHAETNRIGRGDCKN